MTRFYQPDLSENIDSPFVRGKRCSDGTFYWQW